MADTQEALDPDCLGAMVLETHTAHTKWYNIGLQLGLAAHTLDSIKIECLNMPVDCHRDMLKEWLKTGDATKESLATALSSPTVREHRLASEVRGGLASPATTTHHYTDILPYGCGCGQCSFDSYLLRGCPQPSPSTSSFPFLATEGLTKQQQVTLTGQLYDDFEQISYKFSRFTRTVCESLIAREVPLKKLVRSLRDLKAFQPTYSQSPLLQDRFKELREAEDIDAVFDILTDYTSFFNYSLIGHMIREHGGDEDKEALRKYQDHLTEYCKRGIFECPVYTTPHKGNARRPPTGGCNTAPHKRLATLVLKVDNEVVEKGNLKHLGQLTLRVSRSLGLTEHCLQLCSVQCGCVCLVYQFPSSITTLLFPLSLRQQHDLQALGVTVLTDHYTLQQSEAVTHRPPTVSEGHTHRPPTVCELESQPWYHGNITRGEAEDRLQSSGRNTFLLRAKETPGAYTLSESYNGTLRHYLLNRGQDGYELEGRTFNTVTSMMQYLQTNFLFKPCLRTVRSQLLDSDGVAMVTAEEGTGDSGFGTGSGDDGFITTLPTATSGCGQDGSGCGQDGHYTSLQQNSLVQEGTYTSVTRRHGDSKH